LKNINNKSKERKRKGIEKKEQRSTKYLCNTKKEKGMFVVPSDFVYYYMIKKNQDNKKKEIVYH
jgi:hypothetical protein